MDKIGSQNGIDKFAENLFDERALRNNNLYTSTEDLETAFNQYMQTEFSDTLSDYIDRYKDQEISDVLKTYRFELENLE
jgi:predicted metalloprotease with PDZ domain